MSYHDKYLDIASGNSSGGRITKIEESEGRYSVQRDDGWWSGFEKTDFLPMVGDWIVTYGRGMGQPVRGIDIEGEEVYYRTEPEDTRKREEEQKARDAIKKTKAGEELEKTNQTISTLPRCFQKRIQRFRKNNPDFYWQYESYELFCCVDAIKISNVIRNLNPDPYIAARQFYHMPFDEQKRLAPNLDNGHSGNSFAFACRLAAHFLSDERLVFSEHMAMSQLIGCETTCPPVTKQEMVDAGYEPFEELQ